MGYNLNAVHRTVMRKKIYDDLSSGSLELTDVDTWIKNKLLTHPKRIDSHENDFTIAGKSCLTRALTETERRFFGNAEGINFTESEEKCDISLPDREKGILLIEKRVLYRKIVFSLVNNWREDQDALKSHCMKYFMKCESHERESLIKY